MNGTNEIFVIALDGPAGSGKSTVAARVAETLGCVHADSGAMYRTLTLALMRALGAGDTADDFGARLAQASGNPTERVDVSVVLEAGRQSNRIDGIDVGNDIRTPEVTARIRFIADDRSCREYVNDLLRGFSRETGLVVDGRDIGSVVFPETPFKFYLDASVERRAERRYEEWKARHPESVHEFDPKQVEREIVARDRQDQDRPFGALTRPDGAILIDTSSLDVDAVVHVVLTHLQMEF